MTTSCAFQFGFWDVTARGDAALEASGNQSWARIADINEEKGAIFPDVATLEPNFGWPLDGTKAIMPDNPAACTWGWWSSTLCGEDGSFAVPLVLTVTFFNPQGPSPHSSAGITLEFFATLPAAVNIRWYGRQGELLATGDYVPEGMTCFCEKQVENYYKLVVTIRGMRHGRRYLRMRGILFGVLETIGAERAGRAVLTEEVSPASLSLPVSTLDLSFFTADGRFALLDPKGAYQLFQWRQKLTAFRTLDGEESPMGVYYLQEASGTEDEVTALSCVDILGILDTLEFSGGIYEKRSAAALLREILDPEEVSFVLDAALEQATVTGHLPICSKRTALQQIAFAIGAVLDVTRGEALSLIPAPVLCSAVIGADRKVLGHKVALEELVTQVDVTAHQYRLESTKKQLAKVRLPVGTHTVTFSAPVSATEITGGTLVENHPNYCVVRVTTEGDVMVNGFAYQDTTTVYTAKTDPLPAGAIPSVKAVAGATLVDSEKAQAAALRLHTWYQNRYTQEGQILPGSEQPGDLVELRGAGSRALRGYVQRMVTDLVGGSLITISVRGRGV